MTTPKGKAVDKRAWRKKYIQAMVDQGVDRKFANEFYLAAIPSKSMPDWGHDYTEEPEEAALMEMYYWKDED